MIESPKKVYAYITFRNQILVFEHTEFPEAGIQVPGGTVEEGETIAHAVLREAEEETGLTGLVVVQKLGNVKKDMRDFGLLGIQDRYYFHLKVDQYPGENWLAYEETPSDGSVGPIEFRFYWVDINEVPRLNGDLDEMLPELLRSLKK